MNSLAFRTLLRTPAKGSHVRAFLTTPMSSQDDNASMHPMSRQNSRHSIPAEPEVTFGKRMVSTAEVMVSKIFPAGFGWQGASVVAENAGFDGASLNFALTTGAGDFLGVLTGHTLYMAIKKGVTGSDDINITHEAQTGLLLGSAAFCSGTVWQPIVNFAQSIGLGFNAKCWAYTSSLWRCIFRWSSRFPHPLLPESWRVLKKTTIVI